MPLPPLPSIFQQRPTAPAPAPLLPRPIETPRDGESDSTFTTDKTKKRPRAAPQPDKENARQHNVAKPRKPTYLLQKEERDVLVEEVRVLEAELEALKLQIGLPTNDDHAAVETTRAENFEIEEHIHTSRLYLARLQSLVMQELHTPPVNPLATFIHLPRDTEQRREILRGLRDLKLRRAEEVARERLYHLDHSQAYVSDERFTTSDGIYHCHRLEITPFPNFRSARQLYDALSIFFYNWEISVSELLNQLAIREDSDEIDPTIWNQRIVTVAEDVGCPEELNTVVFARFRNDGDAPVGVITHDTVDIDDLYPYKPLERTCKYFQSVHLVFELDVPGASKRVPVLKSCAFVQQLPPQFPLAPGVEGKLHEHISRWPKTLVSFLRSYNADTSGIMTAP